MMIIIVSHLVLCFVIFIGFLEGYHYLVTTEVYHDDYQRGGGCIKDLCYLFLFQ